MKRTRVPRGGSAAAVAVAAGLAAAMSLCAAQPAAAGRLRAGVGYEYSSGTYGGSQDISETYVPLFAAYQADRWEVRLTVPYVSVSGPATIIGPSGEFAPGPGGTRGGLGDVLLDATALDVVHSASARFHLDLSGRVKFGTADSAQGLGTGENDYAFQVDALKDIDRLGVFASAGYTFRGNPGLIRLRDVPYVSVGGDYLISSAGRGPARIGVDYFYRPAAISGDAAVQEGAVFFAFAAGAHFTVRPYALGGFSNSSPDWGAGIRIAWDSGGFEAPEPEWTQP